MSQTIAEIAASVAATAIESASGHTFDGTRDTLDYLAHCTLDVSRLSLRIIFTRDVGMHSCGWWRNPDYERCWHLSLSPLHSVILVPGASFDPDVRVVAELLDALFREHVSKLWFEPAFSPHGKRNGVGHWRLFCDEYWQPIVPRGEVYSRELTKAGWKSASEVRWLRDRLDAQERERAGNVEVRP